jgi:DNA-binding beta-propeller fold protein YncE
MRISIAAATLALLAGCATAAVRTGRPPLSESEGEVQVYLDPLPAAAARLALQVESVAAVAADGAMVPLELLLPEVRADPAARQRILAVGRLAPGSYGALLVKFRRATLAAEPRPVDLALPDGPARVPVSVAVRRQRATVIALALQYPRSVEQGFAFDPSFAAAVPGPTVPEVAGYCTTAGWDQVTVFDKNARRVVSAIPVGRGPQGIALDPRRPRAYVALSGEDRIAIVDVLAGEVLGRIPLRPGDEPREVGVTPDGRLLVTVNSGSNTASFLDPSSTIELGRVDTGEEPGPLLVEPGGRRAFVLNRRAGSITVLDLANRAVAATLATDAEPLAARANRAGTRLYVIHGGSAYMGVFSLPDLQALKRVYVGLGASALAVSQRSDFIYVGRRDGERLQIFDPVSFFPVSSLGIGAPPAYLALDDVQNALFALEPSRRTVEAVDLLSGRSLAAMEVGDDPYQVALAGEPR